MTQKRTVNLDERLTFPSNVLLSSSTGVLAFFPDLPNWVLLSEVEVEVFAALKQQPVGAVLGAFPKPVVLGVLRKMFRRRITDPQPFESDRSLKLFLYLTNSCNLRCRHCYRFSGMPEQRELTFSEWRDILTPLLQNGMRLFLCGGEPTEAPYFVELVEFIFRHAPDTNVHLLTNGLSLRRLPEGLLSKLYLIQVSLDGPTPQVNDAVRGAGTFEMVLENLACLRDFPGHITVNMTLVSNDVARYATGFPELVDRLKAINPRIVLKVFTETRGGRCVHGCDYPTTQRRRTELSKLLRGLGVPLTVNSELVRNRPRDGCGYGDTLTLDPCGNIFPCGLTDGPSLGSYTDGNQSTWLRRLAAAKETATTAHSPECRDCLFNRLCGGICRVTNYRLNGHINKTVCDQQYRDALIQEMVETDLSLETTTAGTKT